jgi:hypothetical protein
MSNQQQSYQEANKGNLRRYKITKSKAKHSRLERGANGQLTFVMYGASDQSNPDLRSVIELTPQDAQKLAHMGLLELGRESINLDTGHRSEADEAKAKAKAEADEAKAKADEAKAQAKMEAEMKAAASAAKAK